MVEPRSATWAFVAAGGVYRVTAGFLRRSTGLTEAGGRSGQVLIGVSGVGLHVGQYVLVGLECEGNVRVAETLADHLHRYASLISRLPWVRRRSCSRMTGTLARRATRSNAWDRAWGGGARRRCR